MTTNEYWISKTFVVEWALVGIDGTTPIDGATVTGTVTRPTGATAAMVVTAVGGGTGKYRVSYDTVEAGRHAYRLTATGAADDATEGEFIVRPSLVGAATITVDPTTNLGLVRLLISDVNVGNPVFTDAKITAFLTLEGMNVRRAAAQALDTIASNEAMVSKVIRTFDVQVDGAKLSAELRARAKSLREQDAVTGENGEQFGLDVVNFDPIITVLSDEQIALLGISLI